MRRRRRCCRCSPTIPSRSRSSLLGRRLADPVPADAPAEVGVVAAAGALTLKSVPVTTVTCDPALTWEASSAMITAPDMELATTWAAASSAGDLDE